jgi:hypothetical protein
MDASRDPMTIFTAIETKLCRHDDEAARPAFGSDTGNATKSHTDPAVIAPHYKCLNGRGLSLTVSALAIAKASDTMLMSYWRGTA